MTRLLCAQRNYRSVCSIIGLIGWNDVCVRLMFTFAYLDLGGVSERETTAPIDCWTEEAEADVLFGLFQKQCERGRPGRGTPSEERAAREHRPDSEAVSRR